MKGFSKYIPELNPQRVANNFNFYVSMDQSTIYKKVIKEQNKYSILLQEPEHFGFFMQVLNGEVFQSPIKKHIVHGFDLESNGSYKSQFIQGLRLDLIQPNQLSEIECSDILTQCQVLLQALIESNSKQELWGDWALHNLIYSPVENCIFNIDLEGFLTYKPLPEWANLSHITNWIEELMARL